MVEHVKNHHMVAIDAIVAHEMAITEEVDAYLIEVINDFTDDFVKVGAKGATSTTNAVEDVTGSAMVKIPQMAEARGWENAIDPEVFALMTQRQQDDWSYYLSSVAAGGGPLTFNSGLADQDSKSYLARLVTEGLPVSPSLWAVLGTQNFKEGTALDPLPNVFHAAHAARHRSAFMQFIQAKSREEKQKQQAANDKSCAAAGVETPKFEGVFSGGMFTGPGVLSRLTEAGAKLWRLHEEYPIQKIIGTRLGDRAGPCVCGRYRCVPCTPD